MRVSDRVRFCGPRRHLLKPLRCYFELWVLFRRYNRVSYRSSNDLPLMHVVSVCFHGDQPTVFDENFGCIDRALPVSDGARAVDMDIAYADGWLSPTLQPIEQFLRRRSLLRFLGWRSSLSQSFKEADHRRSALGFSPRSLEVILAR